MESALDRFAQTRGAALVGATAMSRQGRLQATIGGAILAVGGVMALIPSLGAPDGVAYGAIGPVIAGGINLAVGLTFQASARRHHVDVALTDEAAALLRALVVRAQVWRGGWKPRNAPLHGPHAWPGYQAPLPPSAVAMEALERAAAAYNRVADALGDAKDERATRLRTAADAGMGEALHQAATGVPLQETVERLSELAGLVERALDHPAAMSPLRSNLEATLEELRAEDEARQELRG